MSRKLDEYQLDELDSRFPLTSLERHLLDTGALDRATLRRIQIQALERGVFVGEELLESGLVDEEAVLKFLSVKQNIPLVLLDQIEPNPEALLGVLVPKAVEVEVYKALLENQTGEHAARMAAMESATRNTEELVDSLTLSFNRARQAAITRELVEIVSGAEAL